MRSGTTFGSPQRHQLVGVERHHDLGDRPRRDQPRRRADQGAQRHGGQRRALYDGRQQLLSARGPGQHVGGDDALDHGRRRQPLPVLLGQHHQVHEAGSATAAVLGDRHRRDTHLHQLRPHLGIEAERLGRPHRLGATRLPEEAGERVLERLLVVAEVEVHLTPPRERISPWKGYGMGRHGPARREASGVPSSVVPHASGVGATGGSG